MKRKIPAVVALLLFFLPHGAGSQQTVAYESVVTRTTDATYIAEKLRNEPEKTKTALKCLGDGGLINDFITSPSNFLPVTRRLPDANSLRVARKAVESGTCSNRNIDRLSNAGESGKTLLPSESSLIYGVADFVIGRTRLELRAAAFRQAKSWFASDTMLSNFFPSTNDLISDISIASTSDVSMLRTAVQQDVAHLPREFWTRARRIPDTSQTRAALLDAVRTAAALSEALAKRETPLTALRSLASIDSGDFATKGGRIVNRTIAMTAAEVDMGKGEEFVRILTSPPELSYAIVFVAHTVLDQSDDSIAALLPRFAPQFGNLASSFSIISKDFRALRQETGSVRREHYVQLAAELIGAISDFAQVVPALQLDHSRSFIQAFRLASSIANAIAAEDYVGAALTMLHRAATLEIQLPPNMMRWATFAGALGSSRTPADVEHSLEEFALPPASYIAKRYPPKDSDSNGAIHLNAYMGFMAGDEWIVEHGTDYSDKVFTGLTMPIGIEFAFRRFRKVGSPSIFMPLVDLGAVASYRLHDEKIDAAPNVKFKSVIAPGMFLTTGLHKALPLAMGLGVQYAPKLRKLENGPSLDALRVGAFIGADIPLFRIR
jgi:hypothetical protein